MTTVSIAWFRQDLRLSDNEMLTAAAKTGKVLPVYIHDLDYAGTWPLGSAGQWWLHHALEDLGKSFGKHQCPLILRQGDTQKELLDIAKKAGATRIFFSACFEPAIMANDKKIVEVLKQHGIDVTVCRGALLFEPGEILTNEGQPYKVYTPFWNKLRAQHISEPIPVPKIHAAPEIKSDNLSDWKLLPHKPDWAKGFKKRWSPGEKNAHQRLSQFLEARVATYPKQRDFPAVHATSDLSPHLHWGEISPRQVWHKAKYHSAQTGATQAIEKFLSELAWREFSTQLLCYFPELPDKPFRKEFSKLKWTANKKHFEAWQQGMTGYPIVDAGMRELWQTGYMHNRVRMIVASFLTKDLMISWQDGAKWFWDTLVDADLANNSFNWQWVAGCGADASPFFRIFNPDLQSRKFDHAGNYIRKYVPELKAMPDKHIHAPSEAGIDILQKAGVTMGKTYPMPIVDHAKARDAALAAYKKL